MKLARQVSHFAALATMVAVMTALSACGGSSASTDSSELDGSWVLESLGGVSDLTPADPSVTSTLTLEDGKASGAGGVNTFRGTYESPADGELSFSPLASTRMAGPEAAMTQEAAFLKALDETARFELDGDRLVLGQCRQRHPRGPAPRHPLTPRDAHPRFPRMARHGIRMPWARVSRPPPQPTSCDLPTVLRPFRRRNRG